MEPAPEGRSSTAKTLIAVLLVGLGLAGLAMSLCGGFFTTVSLWSFISGDGTAGGEVRSMATAFVVMGSASLVVGLLLIFLTVVAWKKNVSAGPR